MNYQILIFLKGKYQMKTCVDIKYIFIQQQQQQRLIPLGGVGYMDQLPP